MSILNYLMAWDATDHINHIDQILLLVVENTADTKFMVDEQLIRK